MDHHYICLCKDLKEKFSLMMYFLYKSVYENKYITVLHFISNKQ